MIKDIFIATWVVIGSIFALKIIGYLILLIIIFLVSHDKKKEEDKKEK